VFFEFCPWETHPNQAENVRVQFPFLRELAIPLQEMESLKPQQGGYEPNSNLHTGETDGRESS